MHRVRIVRDDITTLAVDAIVNAANERMLGGGGVDGAIHRAAGPDLVAACRDVPEVRPSVRCPTAECRITPGFRLPARFVIHTVGPIWNHGRQNAPQLLKSCYFESLQLARKHGLQSIAFPAISCGAYGYPIKQAAAQAFEAISEFLASDDLLHEIILVAFAGDVWAALQAELQRNSGGANF